MNKELKLSLAIILLIVFTNSIQPSKFISIIFSSYLQGSLLSKKAAIPCVVWIAFLVFLTLTLVVIPVNQSKYAPWPWTNDGAAIRFQEFDSDGDNIVDGLDLFPEIDNSILVWLLGMVGTAVVVCVASMLGARAAWFVVVGLVLLFISSCWVIGSLTALSSRLEPKFLRTTLLTTNASANISFLLSILTSVLGSAHLIKKEVTKRAAVYGFVASVVFIIVSIILFFWAVAFGLPHARSQAWS